jgi:3-phenylpropionate/trans-cinnamate dioxygenase ferredoxin reductase component
MEHAYDYLLVGAGMAAAAAAAELRAVAPDASIGLIGEESDPPYARPPLSKTLWQDGHADDRIDLDFGGSDVQMHLGRRVVQIDRPGHAVRDDQGDIHRYGRLLLATGARPRRLDLDGERVVHFRTHADYLRLRRLVGPGSHVAVVGGGFIGGELAASLTGAGCKVTMLFPDQDIGAGRYSDGLAAFLTGYYRENGVDVRPGTTVTGGRADDDGVKLELEGGQHLSVDAVVVGIGVEPDTELAEQAALRVDDGILVDARLRTTDPDIWAAGDVACFHAPALQRRVRVEHEDAALSMGRHAARAMADEEAAYTGLPFFYSDLFDLGFEAVGLLDARRYEVVEDWAEQYRRGVIYYLDRSRVVGVLLWNVWGRVDAARELIALPGPFQAAALKGRIAMDD